MKQKLLFIISIFFINGFTFAKKPSWQEILALNTIQNDDNRLKRAILLKNEILKFDNIKDSSYAKILHIIARSYWGKKEFSKAIQISNESIKVNLDYKYPNFNHIAFTYYNLGGIFEETQNYSDALKNYNKCLSIWDKLKVTHFYFSNAYYNKSVILNLIGDYSDCILYAEKSIKISHKFPEIQINAVFIKAQALIKLKNYNSAEFLLKEAIGIINRNKLVTSYLMPNLYFLLGYINEELNKTELALSYYQQANKIYKASLNNLGSANIMLTIGEHLLKKRQYNNALSYFNKCIKLTGDYQIYKLRALDNIGIVNKQLKKFEKSLGNYQEAFSISNFSKTVNPAPKIVIGAKDNEVLMLLIQHKAETWLAYYHHSKKPAYLQNALETFEVADKMVDYMRREHVGYQSKLYWRNKTHSLYENAIEVCFLLKNEEFNTKNKKGIKKSDWAEKAFYFFEKSRAVLLNDKINNLAANQLLSEKDQIKEREFQQQIAQLNSKLNEETSETKRSALNVQLLGIQDNQQKFIKELASKYPSYFAFKYDTSQYSLLNLKPYLSKSKLSFIEYFKGDSANYQLVIKPTGTEIIKQKPDENIYQHLINAKDLSQKLVVSQDGEFAPLDTLKSPNGQYLINKYAFSYTYSAQYLLKNNESIWEESWFKNFIGYAPVNYSKSMDLPSLLGADRALKNVSGGYFMANIFQNQSAKKSNFRNKAGNYKIIQLFTHADADNAKKEPTIFFADSAMKVSELESMGRFNTQLLVLSACKTNVGKVAKGEGTLSMAREFAGLGIPATITTLWSVENTATYQITEFFYKFLKNGDSKDIALQKAKLEYINSNSIEKQNPNYWAAFMLMGETAPLKLESNSLIINTMITIAVFLLAYILRNYRIRMKTN